MPVRRTFWERCESEETSFAECRYMVGEPSVVKCLVNDSRDWSKTVVNSLYTFEVIEGLEEVPECIIGCHSWIRTGCWLVWNDMERACTTK